LSYFQQDAKWVVVACLISVTGKRAAEAKLQAQHQRVATFNAALEQAIANRTQTLEAPSRNSNSAPLSFETGLPPARMQR